MSGTLGSDCVNRSGHTIGFKEALSLFARSTWEHFRADSDPNSPGLLVESNTSKLQRPYSPSTVISAFILHGQLSSTRGLTAGVMQMNA